jgi:hypothetical protein
VLDTGCCGLAGSFGYERGERYEVSIKAAEQEVLPAVRRASPYTLRLTDGFSCRSQIGHGADRGALHLAQVSQMALKEGPNRPAIPRPDVRYSEPPAPARDGSARAAMAAGAVVALGGLAVCRRSRTCDAAAGPSRELGDNGGVGREAAT